MVKRCGRESLVWRGIQSTWDKVLSGCMWNVGYGTSIRLWKDTWIMSGHSLLSLATHAILDVIIDLPLAHFYEHGRGWKTKLFSHLLPSNKIHEIVSLHAGPNIDGRDEVL